MENRFNLIDEPWIPVADVGRVSLKDVFGQPEYRALGGNPVQKIALTKLLLAIAQAACTPEDEEAWRALGWQGLAVRCRDYLQRWHERFYLYGERPFLQMPAISAAKIQDYGVVLPEVSTGNTTVLSQIQVQRPLDDGEKAVLLVCLMAFALGGKKTDNSVTLSPGYQGKTASGKPGPAVGQTNKFGGVLHNFLISESLWQTLWLNLLTAKQIEQSNLFPQRLGTAPWEQMPEGEDCAVAQSLKQSLQGRLVPLCRFCLLTEDGLHYSEGLAHASYKEGIADPSVAVNYSGKDPKALWVDPEKRPWRELTSLLGFLELDGGQSFQCLQIRAGLNRARDVTETFAFWSGGLRVTSNSGEQYAAGNDDFVESQIWLHSSSLGASWFGQLKFEMDGIEKLADQLWSSVFHYFKELKADNGKKEANTYAGKVAKVATHLFWQLCERDFQALVDACEPDEEGRRQRQELRRRFARYVQQAYDRFCPRETARQLDAWAKCRPSTAKYLQQEV
ncbi:type I-E CRISPR-associated protein Cse1/CasA [Azotobacter armeniacus]